MEMRRITDDLPSAITGLIKDERDEISCRETRFPVVGDDQVTVASAAGIPVTKQVGSWRLASQSIGERSFCEERQRSHSAGHANHFGDEDMEINGSVRPGPEMCFEVSEAFLQCEPELGDDGRHFTMHSSFRRKYIFREREGVLKDIGSFQKDFGMEWGRKSFGFEEIDLGH
ncbi:hypothetical protein CDAR_373261 [Caerostris darwini]|uniref:Uncharacterized protein n=1 Tax=Caerostris darwini TaxID=1538125 RepID=A0AAV4N0X4_9ARAC|nr:hypothetical protein CDAR_373261 [Caerostris darwini]